MEKPRSRLGRGLGSLLNVTGANEPEIVQKEIPADLPPMGSTNDKHATDRVRQIPVNDILPNPHQPRRIFNADRLRDLAASLKSNGIVQPIVVRWHENSYQLIAGERRLRAAKIAELQFIPAIVREVSGVEQAQLALIENIQREDLNPIERAQSYATLIQQLGLTQAELATRIGEDRSIIANHVRLLQLSQKVLDLLSAGQLSLGHGKLLAGVSSSEEQERLAKLVVDEELSVRNLERMTTAIPAEAKAAKAGRSTPDAHREEVERSLSRQLGTRVQMQSGAKGKGKLLIHFESLDAFESLVSRLHCKLDAE